MLQRKTIEITVGIFMLAGLLSLLMLALNVSGLNDIYTPVHGYEIRASFNNVGGLKPKAKVTVGGVSIGRVTEIYLDNENYVAVVKMVINNDVRNLPEDTQASILTSGLLGDNYIGLEPGFSDEMLNEGSTIAETNTNSAVVLEDLISRFVSEKATSSE